MVNKEGSVAIEILDELLEKEMDRKEFLRHAGAAALALVGIAGLLKSFNDMTHKSVSSGYGSGAYGGAANSLSKTKKS